MVSLAGWRRRTGVTAVEDTMFRALAVLRVVVLVNAFALYLYREPGYARPGLGLAIMIVLTAWTGVMVWAYDDAARRTPVLLVADLAVAVAAIGVTELVKGPVFHATLPGYWVMGAMVAWAIHWRWQGGLVAAAALSLADLLVKDVFTQKSYGNIFLLLIGGPIIGFLSGLLQQMAAERDAALAASTAAAERQRLSRAVHDGVLQVLAIVQRRGAEIGGEALELSRLAGEQEVALRSLIRLDAAPAAASGQKDLAAELGRLATAHVTVALPGSAVPMPADRCDELVAVVGACLSNVRHHVGSDAPAWVLLEDLGDRWLVSVRDEGPGIPEGRLEEAAGQGRLGVAQSIRGRMADLGGTADLHTSSSGTEWELGLGK